MKIKLLKDIYRLKKILDEDETFIIFKGEVLDRPDLDVEIHVLKNKWVKNTSLVQKLTNEYQGQEKLNHNGVVKIHDIDYFKNIYFIVKDHYEGETLSSLIKRGYEFSISEIINIITQLTRILGHCYKEKLKLRSINTNDILLTKDFKIKILKFRSPRNLSKDDDSIPGVSTDLFFLGSLMFELINRESIFSSSTSILRNLKTVNNINFTEQISKELDDYSKDFLKKIIFKTLVSDSEKRFSSYEELLSSLQQFVQEQVDSNDIRNTMDISTEKEETAKTVFADPSKDIINHMDVPEDYLMNDNERKNFLEDERDILFTGMDKKYDYSDDGFAMGIKIYLILGLLAILSTIFLIYIFY